MPHDSRNSRSVSEAIPKGTLGSLGGCLVECDPEQRSRARRVRRRSLVISILTQATVVALLILLPLFGRTERLALSKTFTPIPPYGHAGHRQDVHRATNSRTTRSISHFTFNVNRPVLLPTDGPQPVPSGGSDADSVGIAIDDGPACTGCIDIGPTSTGPRPPKPSVETPTRPSILHFTHLDPAMLIRRVEPLYPPLARQIHKEGRVELRAIITTDGTIRSLEVVSGDPLFYQSAKDAVSQWLYRPTALNGQKVEIDTYITVLYTMPH